MNLSEFDYELPESLIAQVPLAARTSSRLMLVDRVTGGRENTRFDHLGDSLRDGDVLVLNRSRVIPARITIRRETGGAGELLVTRITGSDNFVATGQPLRKLVPGTVVEAQSSGGAPVPHGMRLTIAGREDARHVRVTIDGGDVDTLLRTCGHVPLPPYIRRQDDVADRERYQTVFAEEEGSVAAPTAGLHFDRAMLGKLRASGVHVCSVILHVGPGTFMPLDAEIVEENRLHSESFAVDRETVAVVTAAKREGRRVIAVGTTTTRVLESVFAGGKVPSGDIAGSTDLFIYPGFTFNVIDGLVTNLHLPKSSLLILVAAFLGVDRTRACYRAAVAERYRFFSYGDAMFIR